ncbi:hypothetical protein BJ170DRAFT_684397 [Xylariales sp. AK1849]|nr:hypothetical protein BJ170DRAFT_684397 [Xylariales sp. AK1849]
MFSQKIILLTLALGSAFAVAAPISGDTKPSDVDTSKRNELYWAASLVPADKKRDEKRNELYWAASLVPEDEKRDEKPNDLYWAASLVSKED